MPNYEPDVWNAPDSLNVNNCYNYATDNRNTADNPAGNPSPKAHPATPGGTKDLDPFRIRRIDRRTGHIQLKISCAGLIAACKDDLLHDEGHCANDAQCWRIACFIYQYDGVPGADFHFAREDRRAVPASNGNPAQPAQWSHKPGYGPESKVTDRQFNPDTGKWDGPPITDPSTDNFHPYTFCGYLCVCPGTRVARLEPPREDGMVAMADYRDLSGMSPVPLLIAPSEFDHLLSSVLPTMETPGAWREGFGPGRAEFRFDRRDPAGEGEQAIFVGRQAVTIWDRRLRHFPDPEGTVVRRIAEHAWHGDGTRAALENLKSEVSALSAWVKPALIAALAGLALVILLALFD